MADALKEIDLIIAALDTVRKAIAKRTAKQISSREEKDHLNAIASAWFRTHKPSIQTAHAGVDTSSIDDEFQSVLDGSGRNPTRQLVLSSIRNAKSKLKNLRPVVGSSPPSVQHTADNPPDFSSLIADSNMREILRERWLECRKCLSAEAPLAACVMMGGLLEALLLSRVNAISDKKNVFGAKHAPKDKSGKTRQLKEWTLKAYLDVAHELGWITQSAKSVGDVIRDYRNYVHPQKQLTSSLRLSKQDADILWEIVKAIARQIITP